MAVLIFSFLSLPAYKSARNACHCVFAVCMGMPEGSHTSEPGNDVSEQLQAFGDQLRAEKGRPRNITARPP
jgi:hypothetical protein